MHESASEVTAIVAGSTVVVVPLLVLATRWAGAEFRPVQAPQTRPCAECQTPVPRGTTYCSSRCRNAADDHNDWDGDC